MMLLVGSRAAKHWLPDFRQPKDYDFLCTDEELKSFVARYRNRVEMLHPNSAGTKYAAVLLDDEGQRLRVEFEIAEKTLSSMVIYCMPERAGGREYLFDDPVRVAPLDILYTMKAAHAPFNIHWLKTVRDLHALRPHALIYQELQKLRERETGERVARVGTRKQRADVENEVFFNEYRVQRAYDHDWLHEVTCYYDEPLFLSIKQDREKAEVSEMLFDRMAYEERVKLVQEEAFVLALERLVPIMLRGDEPSKRQIDDAYLYGLQRLGTDLKGNPDWIRDFVIWNFPQVEKHDHDFVGKFQAAVEQSGATVGRALVAVAP